MTAAVLGFALGVWWLQRQAELPSAAAVTLLGGAAACGVTAVLLLRVLATARGAGRLVALVLLVGCAGAGGAWWAAGLAQLRMGEQLQAQDEGRDLSVVGVVASLPARGERSQRFEFEVESVDGGARLPPRLQLSWYQGLPGSSVDEAPALLGEGATVRPGERWRFTVRLKRPHGSVNPHGFDYEAWLLERGLGATGYVRAQGVGGDGRAQGARRAGAPERLGERNSLLDRIEQARAAIRARFLAVLGADPALAGAAGVLVALAVGDQRAIDALDWQVYNRTGVTHLMSISGLHVTLVSGLLAALVSFGWRRVPALALALPARKAAAVAGALSALGYTLLAGFGVPAQRTFFMVAVVAAALWSGRIAAPLRVLALALLAVLLLDPWAVLAPGFWLSFGAVGLIFYVTHGWTAPPESMAPFASTQQGLSRPARWLRRLGEACLRGIADWGRTQWAITLGLAPAALLLFGQVSLVGPLANAVAIPLVSGIITPLALLAAVVPVDGLLFLAAWLMQLLMGFLTWCAWLPAAVWQQPVPPAWTLPLALVGVAWMLAPRGWPLRSLGLALLLPAVLVEPPRPAPGEAWATTLDVGQGLSVLVRTHGHALLYDAGPAWGESDSGERIILPVLRAIGVQRLDAMFVTHNDLDHTGGAISVLDNLPVGELLSSLPEGHPVLGFAQQARPCLRGQAWDWDGVRFEVLHPEAADLAAVPGARGLRTNDLSCVLRIVSQGGARMLLTGDIERAAEARLVQRASSPADAMAAGPAAEPAAEPAAGPAAERAAGTSALRAEVLLAPHHGSRTSSTPEFIAAVQPSVVVVPAGFRNRFGHPRADVLERYAGAGAQVMRTDRDGAVQVRLGAAGAAQALEVHGQRALEPRYWRLAKCPAPQREAALC